MSEKCELLPCPFCGSEPRLYHPHDGYEWWIECTRIGVCFGKVPVGAEVGADKENAIRWWNTRTSFSPAPIEAAGDDLKQVSREAINNLESDFVSFVEKTVGGLDDYVIRWGDISPYMVAKFASKQISEQTAPLLARIAELEAFQPRDCPFCEHRAFVINPFDSSCGFCFQEEQSYRIKTPQPDNEEKI